MGTQPIPSAEQRGRTSKEARPLCRFSNDNPGPLARCLDLTRRPFDPMDATTEKGVR
jgi:hypothetical protein